MANWQMAPPKQFRINSPSMNPGSYMDAGLPPTEAGQDPYNPYRMGLPPTEKGREKRSKVESSWRGGQEHLYDAFGPGAFMDALRRLYEGQQQMAGPALGGYGKAIQGYADAGPAFQQQIGQVGQQYGQGMNQAIGGYGDAARQAAGGQYAAGVSGLGQAQSQINQGLASRMARAGLAGTGVGAARGALGASAGAMALPQLQAGYGQQLGDIAGQQSQMQQGMYGNLLGLGQMGAQGGLQHAGNLLGYQGDLAGRQQGVLDQSNQLAQQNLMARMGMTPDIWSILGQQGNLDQSRKFNWQGLLQGAVGAGTGMIGNRLLYGNPNKEKKQ